MSKTFDKVLLGLQELGDEKIRELEKISEGYHEWLNDIFGEATGRLESRVRSQNELGRDKVAKEEVAKATEGGHSRPQRATTRETRRRIEESIAAEKENLDGSYSKKRYADEMSTQGDGLKVVREVGKVKKTAARARSKKVPSKNLKTVSESEDLNECELKSVRSMEIGQVTPGCDPEIVPNKVAKLPVGEAVLENDETKRLENSLKNENEWSLVDGGLRGLPEEEELISNDEVDTDTLGVNNTCTTENNINHATIDQTSEKIGKTCEEDTQPMEIDAEIEGDKSLRLDDNGHQDACGVEVKNIPPTVKDTNSITFAENEIKGPREAENDHLSPISGEIIKEGDDHNAGIPVMDIKPAPVVEKENKGFAANLMSSLKTLIASKETSPRKFEVPPKAETMTIEEGQAGRRQQEGVVAEKAKEKVEIERIRREKIKEIARAEEEERRRKEELRKNKEEEAAARRKARLEAEKREKEEKARRLEEHKKKRKMEAEAAARALDTSSSGREVSGIAIGSSKSLAEAKERLAKIQQQAALLKSKSSSKPNKVTLEQERVTVQPIDPSYEISPYKSEIESDDEVPKKPVPDWARGKALIGQLMAQMYVDPDEIFQEHSRTCSLDEVFAKKSGKEDYSRRGSSGNWIEDRLSWKEILAYKKQMGYIPN